MLDNTLRQAIPEKQYSDEASVISKSIDQATLIQPDKENDSPENLDKITLAQCSSKTEAFLESSGVMITMTLVTVYALFASDIQILSFPKSSDDIFSSLIIVCLTLFLSELCLSFLCKPGYKWSFYFWLDLVATLSLITDIGWIWDNLIGVSNTSSNGKQLQNAAKASRAGTRTSRVLRIIRLIRLIRLVKLYKNAQIALKNNGENDERLVASLNIENLNQETKVGKRLSELTMKRVIIIVLLLLFILPLFETDFYYTPETSWSHGVNLMSEYVNDHIFEELKDEYISYHANDTRPLSFLSWKNNSGSFSWQGSTNYNDLRYNELYYYSAGDVISITDIRYDTRLESLLNIMKTLFICIVLTFGAVFFTKDAEDLVIRPIERIIDKVKRIASNPLAASEIKTLAEDSIIQYKKKCLCISTNEVDIKENYETKIIEDTIIKIGILLAIGFGEAGAAIIGSNIEMHGKLNSSRTGSKIIGIFGFCDIRNFTDATEELQEGVMMFVNEIAQIIHGVVGKYFGSANKNIGDAFLMVWKFSSDEVYLEDSSIVRNPESQKAFYVPDLALLSFLKILAKINKDPFILKYRSNPKLLQRMPNYEVKLGFGMHLGWAIEGPIGSDFKIDASYLSPHVNLASALEAYTKQYGVPILLSGSLHEMLSPKVKKYCRKIDTVKIKGMSQPISIYTSDSDFSALQQGKTIFRRKDLYVKKSAGLKRKLNAAEVDCAKLFEDSKEIQAIRKGFTETFFATFEAGIEAYLNGKWDKAKRKLIKACEMRTEDGPAKAILNYMSDFNYSAPTDWDKCRYIT